MTELRCNPQALSNWFDRALAGIGHRGSSFSDVDAVTHDEATDRFLFQEFKQPDEKLNRGQARLLKALARRDYLTVWCVRRREDGCVDWCDVASRVAQRLTLDEYRAKFRSWWNNGAAAHDAREPVPVPELRAEDISW